MEVFQIVVFSVLYRKELPTCATRRHFGPSATLLCPPHPALGGGHFFVDSSLFLYFRGFFAFSGCRGVSSNLSDGEEPLGGRIANDLYVSVGRAYQGTALQKESLHRVSCSWQKWTKQKMEVFQTVVFSVLYRKILPTCTTRRHFGPSAMG